MAVHPHLPSTGASVAGGYFPKLAFFLLEFLICPPGVPRHRRPVGVASYVHLLNALALKRQANNEGCALADLGLKVECCTVLNDHGGVRDGVSLPGALAPFTVAHYAGDGVSWIRPQSLISFAWTSLS